MVSLVHDLLLSTTISRANCPWGELSGYRVKSYGNQSFAIYDRNVSHKYSEFNARVLACRNISL